MSSCKMSCDDYEASSVFIETIVKKSRKLHTCCECGKSIALGSTYHKFFYVFDGSCGNEKMCIDCRSAIDAFGSIYLTTFWEDLFTSIQDCGADICIENLDKLTPTALEKVIDIIDEILLNMLEEE